MSDYSIAIEIYKVSNESSTSMMKDIFPINKNPYTLRHNSQFFRCPLKTVYHGTESISNLEPKIWDLVLNNLKEINIIEVFKQATKKMEA